MKEYEKDKDSTFSKGWPNNNKNMRKILSFMHVSLDGFTATDKRELSWIKHDEDMFDFVALITKESDMGLYGRITYDLMQAYWPTAGENPKATKHDKTHAAWYNKVKKVVLSRTLKGKKIPNTQIISEHVVDEIKKIKKTQGKNIVLFGSPTATQYMTQHDLIDEYWLFVNPIILGSGIPLFKDTNHSIPLELVETKKFSGGVIALHYKKIL